MDTIVIDGPTITVLADATRAMVVHNRADCAGRTCVIHAPTDHGMRSFPLHWRPDRGIFERTCPHGIGHPDPDQEAYWRQQAERGEIVDEVLTDAGYELEVRGADEYVSAQMTHGCDGCCAGERAVNVHSREG